MHQRASSAHVVGVCVGHRQVVHRLIARQCVDRGDRGGAVERGDAVADCQRVGPLPTARGVERVLWRGFDQLLLKFIQRRVENISI
jgi:hypothetical protein